MRENEYFIVYLKDGSFLDFDGNCNYVKQMTDFNNCFLFADTNIYGIQTTLGIIPTDNILYIIHKTKSEKITPEPPSIEITNKRGKHDIIGGE